MDLIPIPATKPDSPAVSPDAFGGEPGFGDLIDSLLAGITAANGGKPGAHGEDVDPDDRRGSDVSVHPGPLSGPGLPGADTENPPAGASSQSDPFEGRGAPPSHVVGTPPPSGPDAPAPAPSSPPSAGTAAPSERVVATPSESLEGAGAAIGEPSPAEAPSVPQPAPTIGSTAAPDRASKPAPVSVGPPRLPESGSTAPGHVASPAPETGLPSETTGHQPTPPGSTPSLPINDPDPAGTDLIVGRRETGTGDSELEPLAPPSRIDPEVGPPISDNPEGHIARVATPSQGADRPGMAELVDRIREWADRVENAQRNDTISLKLADPEGELLVRLAMREGRLEVNVSRPGGDAPSWLLDQLDDALTRRGFDMAGRNRRGPEDGDAGDPLADGERPRQRPAKRDRDGLWM